MKNANNVKAVTSKSTLSRVLSYAFRYPIAMTCSLLLSAVTVVFSLLVPILIGDGIDCIVESGILWEELYKTMTLIGGCVLLSAAAQFLQSLCNNHISVGVVRDLRRDAFHKLSRLPLGYLDTHSHGDTLSRIVADADQFSDGLLMGFTQIFTGVLTILGTVVFMLIIRWQIGLIVIFVSPISLLLARFIATRTSRFFHAQTATRGEQTAFAEERIAGLKTVRAFGQEEESQQTFDEINARLEKAAMNATFYSSLVNPSTRFLNNLVYAAVALLGGIAVAGSGFSVGGLTKLLSYANQYMKPFNEISGVVTELKGAFTCAARIFQLIDEMEEPSDKDKEILQNVGGRVAFNDVSFSYVPEKPLIEGLSLQIEQGKRVAIVGRTGSGKTTLINLLMRFYDVCGGAVEVEGRDVRQLKRSSLRENFGMVLQETWLKSGTVRENIKFGREDATEEEMIAAAKAAHAHSFIRRMEKGYDTVLSEDGGNLSEGQKQLLCIARIMLTKPPMLILDEATSSIDTCTELKIADAFAKLMEGRTSFIVAHRLSTIENADLILVLEKGQVVEMGRHGELIKKGGAYAQLYNGQFA